MVSGTQEGQVHVEEDRARWTFRRGPLPEEEKRTSMEVVTGGSMVEASGGLAAVVLSILALSGVAPAYLAPIAAITLGAALMVESVALAIRYWRLPEEVVSGRWAMMEFAGGMVAQFAAGLTGFVLGILAVSGIASLALTTIAALVFGMALLFASGLPLRLNRFETTGEKTEISRFARLATRLATVGQLVIGGVAFVLAILALIGIAPAILTIVTLLIVGVAVLISGTAVGGRILLLLRNF